VRRARALFLGAVFIACTEEPKPAVPVPDAAASFPANPQPANPQPANPQPAKSASIEVIATGDIGGDSDTCGCRSRPLGGLARRVAWVLSEAAKHPEGTLVLDAGDAFFREPLIRLRDERAAKAAAELQADAMKRMNVPAMAVGDRDLALGVPYLKSLAARAGVALLAPNLLFTRTASPAFSRFLVVERAGRKIGIVGAALEPDPKSEAAAVYRMAGLTAGSAEIASAEAAKDARKAGAEVVIGLFHTGNARARAILGASVPGLVDLAIAAHDRAMTPLERIGKGQAALVGTGARGKGLRVVTLPSSTDRIEPIEADLALDEETKTLEVAYGSALAAIEADVPRYSGTPACKRCHAKAFEQWRKTKHAKARATLVAVKQADNPECASCHGVKAVECEACHGAGAAHSAAPEKVHMPFGKPVPERVCNDCHRPAADQKPFVYAERLSAVTH
jgi:2',3'-cyclic-nucleotide 2'-phosphodiesterase (5'-nucleotidase family)